MIAGLVCGYSLWLRDTGPTATSGRPWSFTGFLRKEHQETRQAATAKEVLLEMAEGYERRRAPFMARSIYDRLLPTRQPACQAGLSRSPRRTSSFSRAAQTEASERLACATEAEAAACSSAFASIPSSGVSNIAAPPRNR